MKEGLEDKSICLLIGGEILNKTNSDHIYVLDYENSKAYKVATQQHSNVFVILSLDGR